MSDHDYGLDDLQDHRPDDLAATTTPGARWVTPVAFILAVVALIGGVTFLAVKAEDRTEHQTERECVAAGGRAIAVGEKGTCLVDGVNVAEWRR